ncbi:hypothetical protein BC832DRAFT_128860 [Gaertneriomyces semiglobifer]|nr:hypothetical protein BC832DRAFT_128860 [Gaertneriomyces semiglobifer]
MRIHLTDEEGNVHTLEVDAQLKVADLAALIEAEMRVPAAQQQVLHNGNELVDKQQSIHEAGIRSEDMLLVTGRPVASGTGNRSQDIAETVRQQLLADPQMLRQLTQTQPELARAVMNDPIAFRRMYLELETRRRELEQRQRDQMAALQNADPFDAESQKRIEEEIRRQNISQNWENALEYHPESFGRVSTRLIGRSQRTSREGFCRFRRPSDHNEPGTC